MAPTTAISTAAAPAANVFTFRPVLPADGPALVRFHEALSGDAQRSRFFIVHPHLTATEVDRFTHVDHADREAIIVITGTEIVAVGRYDRCLSSRRAEVAFVTAEDHRGRGLASQLLVRLAAAAQAVGIDEFVAQTLVENRRMLGVFTQSPFATTTRSSDGVIDVTMSLTSVEHGCGDDLAAERLRSPCAGLRENGSRKSSPAIHLR